MKKKVIVLGYGMVGSTIARDLSKDESLEITVADVRPDALARAAQLGVKTVRADLGSPEAIKKTVAEHQVVVGALSSHLGFQTLRAVLEAKKDYCDISFMPEESMDLNDLAREQGVTAVVDCGVTPGISNVMIGWATEQLDATETIDILVGGLPVERTWPFEYKAPFAPADVIEEYTRPARFRANGKMVIREALTEPELLDFPGVGTLEAFNTDGCRSLLLTMDAPNLRERTLRYPGHIELMRVFRHTGLFSKEPMAIAGQNVRPLDVTSALLFPRWQFKEREADLTVMRVVVEGQKKGKRTRYQWDLLDRYDDVAQERSMSRTTGFPCAIMTRLLASQRFVHPGVNPPELAGREPGILDTLLKELALRGVHCRSQLDE